MARKELNISKTSMFNSSAPGVPEPIPATQAEINEQADIAIKDLFPRIPNFDRRTIIDRAFNLVRLESTSGELQSHTLTVKSSPE